MTDKVTQKEAVLEMFALHNNVVTLAQWLNSPLAAEYRARLSELRKQGYDITCKKGAVPSENTYTLQTHSKPSQDTLPEKPLSQTERPIRGTSVSSGIPALKLDEPWIFHERNQGCLNCGAYFQAASIGEKCTTCL